MIIPTLSFALLLSSHQESKVSLDLRGARMENAAPILAQTLGLSYVVAGPTIVNDVLLVRCKDVTPQELKDRIAKALNATWEQRPDGWRLAQSEEQIAHDRAINDSNRLKGFAKTVDVIQKKTEKIPAFDEATCKKLLQSIVSISKIERTDENLELIAKRLAGIDANSPQERLGLQIARRITPQMFMRLSRDRPKIVYCNHPTAMQIALPFSVDDLLKETVRNQNLWLKIAGTNPVHGKVTKTGSDADDTSEEDLGTLNSSRTPYTTEDLSVVTITLNNGQSQSGIEIDTYGSKGDLTFSTNIDSNGEADDSTSSLSTVNADFVISRTRDVESKDPETPVLKGEAGDFFNLLYQNYDPANGGKKPNQALLKKLLQPERFDPLSFATPEIVLAKVKAPNIVMLLDESMMDPNWGSPDGAPPEQDSNTVVEDSKEWLVSRLTNPVATREAMTSRKVFGPIVRYLDQNRRELTLEEDASLMFADEWNKPPSWLFERLKSVTQSGGDSRNSSIVMNSYMGGYDAGKRIYGSLTEVERKQILQREVSVGSLSAATRQELYRAIFFGGQNGYSGGRNGNTIDFNAVENMTPEQERLQMLVLGGALRDPTFAMPNGIQSEYKFRIQEVFSPTLSYAFKFEGNSEIIRSIGQATSENQVNAEGLGRLLYDETKPREKRTFGRNGESLPDITIKVDQNHIHIMTARTIDITLQISQWISVSWSLSGTISNDPKVYTLSSLPQQYRDEIRKGYDDAEREYKEQKNQEIEIPVRRTPPPRTYRT